MRLRLSSPRIACGSRPDETLIHARMRRKTNCLCTVTVPRRLSGLCFTAPLYHLKLGLVQSRFSGYSGLTDMRSNRNDTNRGFRPGRPRYWAAPQREARAKGFLNLAGSSDKDRYIRALDDISAEDEEIPLPGDQGPIVFKDGIFQIDVHCRGESPPIDPALKGLIDSILGT